MSRILEDYGKAMQEETTPEEEQVIRDPDRMVVEKYPKCAAEYAPLAKLEKEMAEPEAVLDQKAWKKMKEEHDRLANALAAAMKERYGVDLSAGGKG